MRLTMSNKYDSCVFVIRSHFPQLTCQDAALTRPNKAETLKLNDNQGHQNGLSAHSVVTS